MHAMLGLACICRHACLWWMWVGLFTWSLMMMTHTQRARGSVSFVSFGAFSSNDGLFCLGRTVRVHRQRSESARPDASAARGRPFGPPFSASFSPRFLLLPSSFFLSFFLSFSRSLRSTLGFGRPAAILARFAHSTTQANEPRRTQPPSTKVARIYKGRRALRLRHWLW